MKEALSRAPSISLTTHHTLAKLLHTPADSAAQALYAFAQIYSCSLHIFTDRSMSPCRRGSAAMGGIDRSGGSQENRKKGLKNRKGFSGNDGHPGHFLSLATGCVGKERTYRTGVSSPWGLLPKFSLLASPLCCCLQFKRAFVCTRPVLCAQQKCR